ncbi:transporter substrate-binding protein [Bermanella sp. WJH001]|uniref:transporter substrate-binding protein n=1 Tax=Bermanella sp. WJH001 TaxID=3048005 RepID=UPI0024BED628|nr:transporter substrate-binding protein [Bermanella sp. WJH001]MDJ1537882.1 transporter substrate-binding protein [Bermanella sp. WJH001]
MKLFQIVCAFLLVVSVSVGIWFISSSFSKVHIYLVNDAASPELMTFAKNQLESIVDEQPQLSYSLIDDPSNTLAVQDHIHQTIDDTDVMILGCFTEACKLNVITALGQDNTIPFLFTGRSNGLVSESYLWNFGPVFNQSIQPILGVIDRMGYEPPVLVSDESVSAYLTSNILKDLMAAKGWKEFRYINIEQDFELAQLEELIFTNTKKTVINTVCQSKGERVLEKLASTKALVFNTCLPYRKTYHQGYFSSVLYERHADNEQEYIFSLALYFVQLYITNDAFKFNKLVNLEFPIHNQTVVMDYQNRHIWHQVLFIGNQDNQTDILYKSEALIRPVVYHQLRQPTEWELMVQLYWRNHNGSWGI